MSMGPPSIDLDLVLAHEFPPGLRFHANLLGEFLRRADRKSTRLNSSHRCISYAVFCLKKKKEIQMRLWDQNYREIKIDGAFGRVTTFRRALALMTKMGVGRLITARSPLALIAKTSAHV